MASHGKVSEGRSMPRLGWSALLAFLSLIGGDVSLARSDDFTMVVRITYPPGRTVETTSGWSGRKKVMDAATSRTIIDLDRQVIMTVDKRAQTYVERSLAEVRAQVDDGTREHRHLLRRLSKDLRNTVGSIGGAPNWRFSMRPTHRRTTVAGLPAVSYLIEGGPIQGEIWITSALTPPADAREWERLTTHLGGLTSAGTKLSAAVAKLGGVVVRTRLKANGQEVTSETVEVRRGPVPDELLSLPAGARLVRRGV